MSQRHDPITFRCPHCDIELTVSRVLAGVEGPCPTCNETIRSPYPGADTPPEVEMTVELPDFDDESSPLRKRKGSDLAGVSEEEDPASGRDVVAGNTFAPLEGNVISPSINLFRNAAGGGDGIAGRDDAGPMKKGMARREIGTRTIAGLKSLVPLFFVIGVLGLITFLLVRHARTTTASSNGNAQPVEVKPSLGAASATVQAPGDEGPSLMDWKPSGNEPGISGPRRSPTAAASLDAVIEGDSGSLDVPDITRGTQPAPWNKIDLGAGDPSAQGDPEGTDDSVADDSSLLEGPRAFVERYLSTRNWEDLVPLTREGERFREEMETYYTRHPIKPDPIRIVSFVNLHTLKDSDKKFFVFSVYTKEYPKGFVMNVEETDDGYVAEWKPFVEFRDRSLPDFYANPKVTPAGQIHTFYLTLRRYLYFKDDIPDAENKWCFQVSIPVGGAQPGYVFIPKYTDYGRQIDQELEWNRRYVFVADLNWVRDFDDAGEMYVRLMNIRHRSWRPDFGQQ